MTGANSEKSFSFLWRNANASAWHRKRVPAFTIQDAIEAMRQHLSKRSGFPDSVVVDHPVFEMQSGMVSVRTSLTSVASPFRVEYDNLAHPVGHFPVAK